MMRVPVTTSGPGDGAENDGSVIVRLTAWTISNLAMPLPLSRNVIVTFSGGPLFTSIVHVGGSVSAGSSPKLLFCPLTPEPSAMFVNVSLPVVPVPGVPCVSWPSA